MSAVKCRNCQQTGHLTFKCPNRERSQRSITRDQERVTKTRPAARDEESEEEEDHKLTGSSQAQEDSDIILARAASKGLSLLEADGAPKPETSDPLSLSSQRLEAIARAYDESPAAPWVRKDYSHVLEVYDFPSFLKPHHLTQALGPSLMRVEAVDEQHYLAIFRTPKHAQLALEAQSLRSDMSGSAHTSRAGGGGPSAVRSTSATAQPFKLRSWDEAESAGLVKEELIPEARRPPSDTRTASRLIAGHLNIRTGRQVRSRAELDAEKLRERERRAARRAEKEKGEAKDAWD
eukprot:g26895.t1